MIIPTEPIGSIPRPLKLLDAITRYGSSHPSLGPLYEEAVQVTIEQFEAACSPIVTDGEQRKYQNSATYCVDGLQNTAPDGFKLPFATTLRSRDKRRFAKIRSRVEGTALVEDILNAR